MSLIVKYGIAWRVERDAWGRAVREVSASPGECAREIERLNRENENLRAHLEGRVDHDIAITGL